MKVLRYGAAITALMIFASTASAAEICGNGLDDDANGLTDEGCYPSLTSGVCESPLSCSDTGAVSWTTGGLHYVLPPDVETQVPIGPNILSFRRIYTSMYTPSQNPAPVNRTPFGQGWQHNYLSWVSGSFGASKVVWHRVDGRDVLFTLKTNSGGVATYLPQAGDRVLSFTMTSTITTVKLMTGETLRYSSVGQLTEIWDTLPTPNKVLVTWDATSNGNVLTVTDAAGKQRLLFGYTSGKLTTTTLQHLVGASWISDSVTTYGYGNSQLLTVTTGGTLVQQNSYATGGYLSSIKDAANTQLIGFGYSTTTAGRVHKIASPQGILGFDYSSSRATCTGKTLVYFNLGNATSCATDTDCGTGFLCGGQTAAGATGSCYRAARCLTTTTIATGEKVVTNVAPIGGGGTCTGACAAIINHSWSSLPDLFQQVSIQDANLAYTSIALCAATGAGCTKGKPYQIGFGDTDQDPTNGGTNRTMWIYYDSTYPDRIQEIRRPSNINPSLGPCSYTNAAGCERTVYLYGAVTGTSCLADNQLCRVDHYGYTLDSAGNPQNFTNITSVTTARDSRGRIAQIDRSFGRKSVLQYFLATDPYPNRLKSQIDYTDTTSTLTTLFPTYDLAWGTPTTIQSPNGMLACQTYDASFGYLASSRIPMAGQVDCTTPNAADLTTSWVVDVWLKRVNKWSWQKNFGEVKKLTKPDGSCVFTTVDVSHRVSQVLRRDDCLSTSSGDTQTYQYTPDNKVYEIDTADASGTIKAKQVFDYFAGGQLQKIYNPANLSVFEGLQYDVRGNLIEVDGEAALTKSVLHYDNAPGRDHRVTSEDRYKSSTAFDSWTLLYSWEGNQLQVTDGDAKITQSVTDDFGHIVKLTTPDLAGPTLGLYDISDNLVTAVEDLGGGVNQLTHTYTYDRLNRPLTTDDPGACATTGTPHAEIQRYYDALPSGVTCPIAGGCNHLAGRIAYVQTILLCSPTYNSTDGSLDQFTFYSYDAAGRLVEEYIKDDTGRVADQTYTYTKNGGLASVGMPSGASVSWGYGSAGNNSDTDRVTSVSRSGTAVVDTVTWFPFGPLQQYNQKNTLTGNAVQTTLTRDLAYRTTDVKQKAGATTLFDTALSLDARGRVTSRVYTGAASGVQSSYFLYDGEERVTCETTNLQSTCPTTGTNIKNNHSLSPAFTNAGDWKRVLRPIAGSTGGLTNDFNTSGTTYGATHRITDMNQSDGTPAFGHTTYTYDARGSRSSDDNAATLAHDGRTYTYDGRRNLSNVRGEYPVGGGWHFYDVASAFDGLNRRVYKSFFDETTLKTATWFFYYDPTGRMTEIVYTPDASVTATYSVFQLLWLGDRLVAYWQTDLPGATTTKRYVGTDETGRPIDMWNWPVSGDTTRVWAINPDAWGNDLNIVGSPIFQPILFDGQYQDKETAAYENDGLTIHRPGLVLNGVRTYDPQTGSYFQVDPLVHQTWSSYGYANTNPVVFSDPSGLDTMQSGTCAAQCEGYDVSYASCMAFCNAEVDMGLGGPSTPYNTNIWSIGFGNAPCFDPSCHKDTDRPFGPSFWYGTADGHAGPYWFAPVADFLNLPAAGTVACMAGGLLGGILTGGSGAVVFGIFAPIGCPTGGAVADYIADPPPTPDHQEPKKLDPLQCIILAGTGVMVPFLPPECR